MMAPLFAAVAYASIALLGSIALRAQRIASPVFWLPIAMGIIALPTFALIDMSHQSDSAHLLAFLVAVGSFITVSVIYQHRTNLSSAVDRYRLRPETADSQDAVVMAVLLLTFSVSITVLYFYLVGYNLLFLLLAGTVSDYSAMRLSAYSGDSYFAPGYVNQFKNSLYPVLAASLVVWLRAAPQALRWFAGIVAVLFGVFALLGTGQRIYILFAICSTMYGLYLFRMGRQQIPIRLVALLVVPALLLFVFMTIAYKQIAGAGPGDVLIDIAERLLRVQQEGGLIGFRFFATTQAIPFDEWVKGFIGIIPGREGSMVAHQIHGELYGSTQGTVPLTAVGSAYLNGGLFAVALLFSALGLIYSHLFHRFLEGPRTVLRSFAYGALFFYLGSYVVGPPESLIDSGVVAVGGLLLLRRLVWMRWTSLRTHTDPRLSA